MNFSEGPKIGENFPHKAAVSSLAYHADGERLFAATEADSKLYVINTKAGKLDKHALRCEREGVSLVSATHHHDCVLIAGPKSNAVHYWSVYDNKLLRKFRGHSGPVNGISLSPCEDKFLTSSTDRTVRLWNLKEAGCVAQMELPSNTEGQPRAVFDSTGMVFAIMAGMAGSQGHYIHLYDAQNYSGGAFSELQVSTNSVQEALATHRVLNPPTEPLTFNSLKFNASGNRMLVQSDQGLAIVLDGYDATVERIFQSDKSRGTVSCFTPDDQSVLMGAEDGTIDCWNIQSGDLVKQMKGNVGSVSAIECNPKYKQIASSCTSTCLWIW